MSSEKQLTIGDLGEATGVSVSALRYYDELGLMAPSERIGGKRRFISAAVGRVNFVLRAQGVGFSLSEIHGTLDDAAGEWNSMVVDELEILRSQRSKLDTMISILEEVRECGCQVVAECERLLGLINVVSDPRTDCVHCSPRYGLADVSRRTRANAEACL